MGPADCRTPGVGHWVWGLRKLELRREKPAITGTEGQLLIVVHADPGSQSECSLTLLAGMAARRTEPAHFKGPHVTGSAWPQWLRGAYLAEPVPSSPAWPGGHVCVTNVHALRIWEIASGFPASRPTSSWRPGDDCHKVPEEFEQLLGERFDIGHATLQVDHDQAGRLLSTEKRPPKP